MYNKSKHLASNGIERIMKNYTRENCKNLKRPVKFKVSIQGRHVSFQADPTKRTLCGFEKVADGYREKLRDQITWVEGCVNAIGMWTPLADQYDQDKVSALVKILEDHMRMDEILRGILDKSIKVTPAY